MRIIKRLRAEKGISQKELSIEIGVSPRTIQNYERENADIPNKRLDKIAKYFDMTIAEMHLREVSDFRESYAIKKELSFKHGSVFYPLDYGKHLVMVPLVLMEGYQKYIETIGNRASKKSSFQIGFVVDTVEEETQRAFEITGDSMNDRSIHAIPNKAIVLGISFNKEAFATADTGKEVWNQSYVLICDDRIMCKQVTGFDKEKASIRCHSLNPSPEYQDFELPLKDILQVFRIVKKQI